MVEVEYWPHFLLISHFNPAYISIRFRNELSTMSGGGDEYICPEWAPSKEQHSEEIRIEFLLLPEEEEKEDVVADGL